MRFGFLFLFVALAVLCVAPTSAQIPNPGFENWATDGNPVGWYSNNASPFYTTITKSTTAHSGTAAVRGAVDSAQYVGIVAPWIWAGGEGEGFGVSQRHANLTGYYQFNSVGGDQLYVWGWMLKGDTMLVAYLTGYLQPTAGSYVPFTTPFNYYYWYTHEVPDSCYFYFTVTPGSGQSKVHKGTSFLLDDLAFTGISGVGLQGEGPLTFSLDQNYPNPFNPSTTIGYQIAKAGPVSLKVYDLLGREVATLVDGIQDPGRHVAQFDARRLASGMYVYRLIAGSFVDTRQMMVLK